MIRCRSGAPAGTACKDDGVRRAIVKPKPLAPGSHLRVIAPSRSLALITPETRAVANRRFAEMGLSLSFGAHVEEIDEFDSATIEHRVSDLHTAFADPTVDGILTVIGGHNSNQLLPHIDWDLIAANPKVFCGYSDITVLSCAIHAHTGLITYSGPHYSTFGMKRHFEATQTRLVETLFNPGRRAVRHSATWTDDAWHLDQDDRTVRPTDGPWILKPGTAAAMTVSTTAVKTAPPNQAGPLRRLRTRERRWANPSASGRRMSGSTLWTLRSGVSGPSSKLWT